MPPAEPPIRRIVVALDPSVHGRAAIEAAASMAARLRAELVGLYVEDVRLLNLASYPFAREFSVRQIAGRTLSGATMTRALRTQAERARGALAETAARHRVAWSFDVRRGEVAPELVAAAQRGDLLVLGRTSATTVRHRRVGSTVRTVVHACTTAVLVVPGDGEGEGPVVALFDQAAGGRAVVAMAAALAGLGDRELVVLVAEAALEADAEAALARAAAPGRVVVRAGAEVDAALAELALRGTPTLVARRAAESDRVLDRVACPVVLVG